MSISSYLIEKIEADKKEVLVSFNANQKELAKCTLLHDELVAKMREIDAVLKALKTVKE